MNRTSTRVRLALRLAGYTCCYSFARGGGKVVHTAETWTSTSGKMLVLHVAFYSDTGNEVVDVLKPLVDNPAHVEAVLAAIAASAT